MKKETAFNETDIDFAGKKYLDELVKSIPDAKYKIEGNKIILNRAVSGDEMKKLNYELSKYNQCLWNNSDKKEFRYISGEIVPNNTEKNYLDKLIKSIPNTDYKIEGNTIILSKTVSKEDKKKITDGIEEHNDHFYIENPPSIGRKIVSAAILGGMLALAAAPFIYFGNEAYKNHANNDKIEENINYEVSNFSDSRIYNVNSTKHIMFRDDDAQAWSSVNSFRNITETLMNKRVPQTIGLIPGGKNSTRLDTDPELVKYLNQIKKSPYIEIAMHGVTHTNEELDKMGSYNEYEANELIGNGLNIIESQIGYRPKTFIPPEYIFTPEIANASGKQNITHISSFVGFDPDIWKENPPGLLHVPGTVSEYSWEGRNHRTFQEITGECESNLEKYNACMIVLHHLTYREPDGSINQTAYKTLLDLLDWTKKKESEGVGLITIGEYK